MKRFKLYDTVTGWAVFAVAATVYLMTIEPTGSLWDCGEFISSAYKLEVGHPPGAPFFMLTGRLFSLFASDPTKVAAMVNSMSALCSAFTILLLFWSITHIARRIVTRDGKEITLPQGIAILGSGAVGALAYTFSDTFWFSAVEGEVYAYSSLFTALVVWCMLKWEDQADSPSSARWLVLISYLMGLSIGVHLLNLLAIPALVLLYYFRKYPVNARNTIAAVIASVLLLAAVLYGMIPGFIKVASRFELLFVNGLGCSFNTGMAVYIILTAAILIWAIYETQAGNSWLRRRIAFLLAVVILGVPFMGNGLMLGIVITAAIAVFIFVRKELNRHWLNMIVVCMTVMLIGYSSYTMLVVRSMANTPMDQNSPEDVFSLQSYLNREQYGDNPLFYGPLYSAPRIYEVEGNMCKPIIIDGSTIWQRKVKETDGEKDSYISAGKRVKGVEVDPRFKTLFPRMYSTEQSHIQVYEQWGKVKGTPYTVDICGRQEQRVMPTFGENLRFFFSYQVGFMYWRYFLWNFSGRQNDFQGHGEIDKGNWITGLPFIDNALYGDQSKLPDSYRNNRGHNVYFMLPLLLGLLGLLWQLSSKRSGILNFWIVFTLFFMTGLAIVVYLNQTPYQPRERDYAYAGSFYAFSIWIGLGVMFFYDLVKRFAPRTVAAVAVSLLCLGVPALMAQQNWDDHDRSQRTLARDLGSDYLNSCEEDAIYFCNGDNDTFCVWFNQEVEGRRTDVRACNLSYLSTDWYIDQMKRGAYESAPLPISWHPKDYAAGHLDFAHVIDHPQFGGKMDLGLALMLLRDSRFIDEDGTGCFFARTLTLPIDKEQVIRTGTVPEKDRELIADTMYIRLNGNIMNKSQIMFLEMLYTNDWVRPIYIATTVGESFYPDVNAYLQLEGMAQRIVPLDPAAGRRVNSDVMYRNIMERFRFGNAKIPSVYLDEPYSRSCRSLRMVMNELAGTLIREGRKDEAKKVLDKSLEELPDYAVPFDYWSARGMIDGYYALGETSVADSILIGLFTECDRSAEWMLSLPPHKQGRVSSGMSLGNSLAIMQELLRCARRNDSPTVGQLEEVMQKYAPLLGR